MQVTLLGHSAGGWLGRAFVGDPLGFDSPPATPGAPHAGVRALVTLGTPQRPPPAALARDMTGGWHAPPCCRSWRGTLLLGAPKVPLARQSAFHNRKLGCLSVLWLTQAARCGGWMCSGQVHEASSFCSCFVFRRHAWDEWDFNGVHMTGWPGGSRRCILCRRRRQVHLCRWASRHSRSRCGAADLAALRSLQLLPGASSPASASAGSCMLWPSKAEKVQHPAAHAAQSMPGKRSGPSPGTSACRSAAMGTVWKATAWCPWALRTFQCAPLPTGPDKCRCHTFPLGAPCMAVTRACTLRPHAAAHLSSRHARTCTESLIRG